MKITKALPKGLTVDLKGSDLKAKLYQTEIVCLKGNKLTLRCGGWFTRHTKKCINLVLKDHGVRIFQDKNQWFVFTEKDGDTSFQEGMTINL